MVSVLLTRPRTASEQLAHTLKSHGYDPIIEPLLAISATHAARPNMEGVTAVMVTSGNALTVLNAVKDADLCRLPCFCVGTQTANDARTFGFREVYDAAGDGAALAQLIATKHGKGAVLHIAGRDIDSTAHDELVKRGVTIAAWPVYSAVPAPQLPDKTIRHFRDGVLDAVLIFSARTAATLKALLVVHKLEACCQGLIAIGISDAAVASLKPLPWRTLSAAIVPTEAAVIERLQELCPLSKK